MLAALLYPHIERLMQVLKPVGQTVKGPHRAVGEVAELLGLGRGSLFWLRDSRHLLLRGWSSARRRRRRRLHGRQVVAVAVVPVLALHLAQLRALLQRARTGTVSCSAFSHVTAFEMVAAQCQLKIPDNQRHFQVQVPHQGRFELLVALSDQGAADLRIATHQSYAWTVPLEELEEQSTGKPTFKSQAERVRQVCGAAKFAVACPKQWAHSVICQVLTDLQSLGQPLLAA